MSLEAWIEADHALTRIATRLRGLQQALRATGRRGEAAAAGNIGALVDELAASLARRALARSGESRDQAA